MTDPQSVPSSPQFVILGAGAIGSILGAHLAHAGHSVVMLVRERRAQQLRAEGLRIRGLSDLHVHVPVLTDGSQLKRVGTLIVAMKTLGTAAALEPLRNTHIEVALSIQNGVQKNEQLIALLGKDRVLGSLADTSGELMPSGEALFTRNVMLLVGELTGGVSSRAEALAATFEAAGIRSSAAPEMLSREWSKFAGWAGYMTMAVATRSVTWKFVTEPDAALIVARIVREVGALARAKGIELSDQSILPIVSMCRGSELEAAEAVMKKNENLETVAPLHRVSSLQDFEAGRPLEIEETIGYALSEARRLHVAMPVLESLYLLVRSLEKIAKK